MSSSTKKTAGRRKKSSEDSIETQSPEAKPTVKDWSRDQNTNDTDNDNEKNTEVKLETNRDDNNRYYGRPRYTSVLNFDRNEVAKLEDKKVNELNISDLLKVLIRRGEEQENITVRKECGVLLRKLNGERLYQSNYHPNNYQNTQTQQMPPLPAMPQVSLTPQAPSDEFVEYRRTNYRGGYRGGFRNNYRGNGYGNRGGFRENHSTTNSMNPTPQ